MNFSEYMNKVGRENVWIKPENVDEFAPTIEDLARETAHAYRVYFVDKDHSGRAANNMDVLAEAFSSKYGAMVQIRNMGTPGASLVVYGSRAAWYNGLSPMIELPLANA